MNYKNGDFVFDKQKQRFAIVNVIPQLNEELQLQYLNKAGCPCLGFEPLKGKEIEKREAYEVTADTLKAYLCFEIKAEDFVPSDNTLLNCRITDTADPSVPFLYKAFSLFMKRKMSVEEKTLWTTLLLEKSYEILGVINKEDDKGLLFDDQCILRYVLKTLKDYQDLALGAELFDVDWEWDTDEDQEDVLKMLQYYLEDYDSDYDKRRYTDDFAEYILDEYDFEDPNFLCEEDALFYRSILDHLCLRENAEAIRKKAYAIYADTTLYPQDWKTCKELLEKHYDLTGDPFSANSLGYIFYYGRADDGKPDYEKAYRYFSIGNSAGIHESTYKLGDCFKNGYGIRKNGDIAFNLYTSLVGETRDHFLEGNYDCKFADVALRIGSCFEDGCGVEKDAETAYYWYLQAECAIKKRMRFDCGYGDSVVEKKISRAIDRIRKQYEKTESRMCSSYNFPLLWRFFYNKGIKARANVSENKNGIYKITISLTESPNGNDKKILLSLPECDYCGLVDKIVYTLDPDAYIDGIDDEFYFNGYDHDPDENMMHLLCDGMEVAMIHAHEITLKKPKKEKEPVSKYN